MHLRCLNQDHLIDSIVLLDFKMRHAEVSFKEEGRVIYTDYNAGLCEEYLDPQPHHFFDLRLLVSLDHDYSHLLELRGQLLHRLVSLHSQEFISGSLDFSLVEFLKKNIFRDLVLDDSEDKPALLGLILKVFCFNIFFLEFLPLMIINVEDISSYCLLEVAERDFLRLLERVQQISERQLCFGEGASRDVELLDFNKAFRNLDQVLMLPDPLHDTVPLIRVLLGKCLGFKRYNILYEVEFGTIREFFDLFF